MASRLSAKWIALGIVVVVAAGLVSGWRAGVFSPAASSPPGGGSGPTGSAPVVRTTLTSTVQVGGSIGYGGSYTITAPAPGSNSQATADRQAVSTDQQAIAMEQETVAGDQATLSGDKQAETDAATAGNQTIAADEADVSTDQSVLSADQAKEAQDCAVTSSAATGPDTTACVTDETQVRTDQTTLIAAQQKLAADRVAATNAIGQARAKVASDQAKLTGDRATLRIGRGTLRQDQASLAALDATAANAGTTYTWLPQPGDLIRQDQRAYSVSGVPVPLLYGAIPAYRAFYAGMSEGADVGELTRDLIGLGYGDGLAPSDRYSAATAAAVARWQRGLDLPATGTILLGEVVFEPGPIRVTTVTPSQGSTVGEGGTVLTATGITPVVTVALDVDQEYLVKPGDAVSVVLPDGTSTAGGQVESVSAVATCPGAGGSGNGTSSGSGSQSPCSSAAGTGTSGSPEVTVTITLDSTPQQARLDQAPVNVNITEYRAVNVLAVPVGALIAQPSGGYAVEVAGAGNSRRLVPVTVGLFDDADGMVQVTGALTPGQRVTSAAS